MWHLQTKEGQICRARKCNREQTQKKAHIFFGHHSIHDDVNKSKFTGVCRQWSPLWKIVQNMADSEEDPYNMCVHQRTPEGIDKFGFRYESEVPNGEVSGMFYVDGRIWYQNRITSWYSKTGEFSMTFPSGPGKCEGDTREWKRSSTPLTPQQIIEYSRDIFC